MIRNYIDTWDSGDRTIAWCVGSVFSLLFGMVVAAILDTTTPMPAFSWVLVWVFITLLPTMVAAWYYRPKYARRDGFLRDYYMLPKDIQSQIPAGVIELIESGDADYTLKSETESLIDEIVEHERVRNHKDSAHLIEAVRGARESVKAGTDMYKELR